MGYPKSKVEQMQAACGAVYAAQGGAGWSPGSSWSMLATGYQDVHPEFNNYGQPGAIDFKFDRTVPQQLSGYAENRSDLFGTMLPSDWLHAMMVPPPGSKKYGRMYALTSDYNYSSWYDKTDWQHYGDDGDIFLSQMWPHTGDGPPGQEANNPEIFPGYGLNRYGSYGCFGDDKFSDQQCARDISRMTNLLDQWKQGFSEPFYLHETSYNNGDDGVAVNETKRMLPLEPVFNWPYNVDEFGSNHQPGLEIGGFWYEEHVGKPWMYIYFRYNPVQFYPFFIREHWHHNDQPIPTGHWDNVKNHPKDPIGQGGWLMRCDLSSSSSPLPPAEEIARMDSRDGSLVPPPPLDGSDPNPSFDPVLVRKVEQGGITVWVPTTASDGFIWTWNPQGSRDDSGIVQYPGLTISCEIISIKTGHILAETSSPELNNRTFYEGCCHRFQFLRRGAGLKVVQRQLEWPPNESGFYINEPSVPVLDHLEYLSLDGSNPEEWEEGIEVVIGVRAIPGSFAEILMAEEEVRFITNEAYLKWRLDLHEDLGLDPGVFAGEELGSFGRPRISVGGLNGVGHHHKWAGGSDDWDNPFFQANLDEIGHGNTIVSGNDTLRFEHDLSAPCQIEKVWSMAKNGNNEFLALIRPTEFTSDATDHNMCGFFGNQRYNYRGVSKAIRVRYVEFGGDFITTRAKIGHPDYLDEIPGYIDPDYEPDRVPPVAGVGGKTPMWDTGFTGGKHGGKHWPPVIREEVSVDFTALYGIDYMIYCSFYEPHLTSYRDTPDVMGYIVSNHAAIVGRSDWYRTSATEPGFPSTSYRLWKTWTQTVKDSDLAIGEAREWMAGASTIEWQGNKTGDIQRPTDNNVLQVGAIGWTLNQLRIDAVGGFVNGIAITAGHVQMFPTHWANDTHELTINPAKLPIDPDHEDEDDPGPQPGPFSIYVTPRKPTKTPFEYDEPNCRCPVAEPDTDASAIVDLCRSYPIEFTSQIGDSQQVPVTILTIRWDDDAAPINYIDRPESYLNSKIKRFLDLQNYGIAQATVLDWGSVTWTLDEGAVGKADSATVTLSGRDIYDRMTASLGQDTVAELSVLYDEGSNPKFNHRATYFSGRIVAPITYDIGINTTTITIESVLGNLKKTVGKLADPLVFTGISDVYADSPLPIVWGCARRVEAVLVDQPWETKSLFDETSEATVIEVTDHPDDIGATPGVTYDAFYGSHRVAGVFTQSSSPTTTPSIFTITSEQSAVVATGIISYMQPNGAFDLSNRFVVVNMDDMHPGSTNWVDLLVAGQTFGVFHTSSLSQGYATYQIGSVEYHQPYANHIRITLVADTTSFQAGDAIEFIDVSAIRGFMQSGTGLTQRGDSASWTYLANMLPSEKVVRVEGFGITLDDEGFDVEGFVAIGKQVSPVDEDEFPGYHLTDANYTVNLSDSSWFGALGHNVTTVKFLTRPRRMHKRLRNDRIWVTLQGSRYGGSFTNNPVRVIQEYLESANLVGLDASDIDTDSFDAAAMVMGGYRVGFAQTATMDAWELLSGIAAQCHSVLQVDGGVVRIVVLRNSVGTQALSIDENYLMDNAIEINETHIDDVASHVYATYRRTWDDRDSATRTASYEKAQVTSSIGRNVREIDLNLYPCRKVVDAEAKFWLQRWGVVYQSINVEMGIEGLCLRPGDWLHVQFTDPGGTLLDDVIEVQEVTFTPGGVGEPPACQIEGRKRLHEFT